MPSLTGTYLVSWMCLGCYLATALGIPVGTVLCVGSNGHVAYEPSDPARVCVATNVSDTAGTDESGRWLPARQTVFNAWGAVAIASNRTCTDSSPAEWQAVSTYGLARHELAAADSEPLALAVMLPSVANTYTNHAVPAAPAVAAAASHVDLDMLRSVILLI